MTRLRSTAGYLELRSAIDVADRLPALGIGSFVPLDNDDADELQTIRDEQPLYHGRQAMADALADAKAAVLEARHRLFDLPDHVRQMLPSRVRQLVTC